MSSLDARANPVLERVSDKSERQIDEPLSWNLSQIYLIRQVLSHQIIVKCLTQNLFYPKAFILRAEEVLDRVTFDNYKAISNRGKDLHFFRPDTKSLR